MCTQKGINHVLFYDVFLSFLTVFYFLYEIIILSSSIHSKSILKSFFFLKSSSLKAKEEKILD